MVVLYICWLNTQVHITSQAVLFVSIRNYLLNFIQSNTILNVSLCKRIVIFVSSYVAHVQIMIHKLLCKMLALNALFRDVINYKICVSHISKLPKLLFLKELYPEKQKTRLCYDAAVSQEVNRLPFPHGENGCGRWKTTRPQTRHI